MLLNSYFPAGEVEKKKKVRELKSGESREKSCSSHLWARLHGGISASLQNPWMRPSLVLDPSAFPSPPQSFPPWCF